MLIRCNSKKPAAHIHGYVVLWTTSGFLGSCLWVIVVTTVLAYHATCVGYTTYIVWHRVVEYGPIVSLYS